MRSFTFVFLLLLAACTTIEITERDAFENHTTITPEIFSYDQYTLQQMDIETEDGETLNGWFLEHANAQATVIYFGGNGFLMVKSRPLITAYADIPVNLVLFDYRGYGLSSGTPSVQGVHADAIAVFNSSVYHFRGNDHPIFLHGHSMGSFLASYIADQNEVAGYILESPITEVRGWTRKFVPWLLRPFVRFDIDRALEEQNNLERVAQIDYPLLIIGGSNDEITAFWMAEALYEASASTDKDLLKIAGGTHNDLTTYAIFQARLREFLVNESL
ncbi:alpha/beta fold hydrolase [soil metagenome]